jgi:hypothetical protein
LATTFGNYSGAPKAVELKIWVRLPNGDRVAAVNAGSDGTLILPASYPAEYAFDLFGVGPDSVAGTYELGCSIVQPTSGEPLERAGYLFEIQ